MILDFERLVKRIIELDAYDLAFSNAKFVHHAELNQLGLHVFRCIKSRLKWEKMEPDSDILTDGYKLSSIDNLDNLHDKILPMVRQCGMNVDSLHFKRKTVRHDTTNVQYNAHVDTFHPAIKVWILLHDVTDEHGPLHILPGSNFNSKKKLEFLHEFSNNLIKNNKRPTDPEYDTGSFRIPKDYLTDAIFKKMTGKKFDVIIADVSAIHHRGVAKPGVIRDTFYVTVDRKNIFYDDKALNLSFKEEQDYLDSL